MPIFTKWPATATRLTRTKSSNSDIGPRSSLITNFAAFGNACSCILVHPPCATKNVISPQP